MSERLIDERALRLISHQDPMREKTQHQPAWSAVFALAMCVAALITAEFLPVSLLSPMAVDLRITEGLAGQAVTATAIVGFFASLFAAAATRRIDRRRVLLAFSVLLIASNLLVAFAPNLATLLLGRVVLGVALGGFWAMSTASVMRLVPGPLVPRALSIVFAAVSVATVISVPLGSYLGDLIGWRRVFLLAAALGVVALVWEVATLPSMPPQIGTGLKTLVAVLKRPQVGLGLVAVVLVFGGHFAFFTYLRPFLETEAAVGVGGLTTILLGFGVANIVGSSVAGPLLGRSLRLTLALMPLAMSVLAGSLAVFGKVPFVAPAFVTLWGFAFATVPVGWSTWLTRVVPDEAETGGGLLVAAIQLAISAGAGAGGAMFDVRGAAGAFAVSAAALLAASALILVGARRATLPGPPRQSSWRGKARCLWLRCA